VDQTSSVDASMARDQYRWAIYRRQSISAKFLGTVSATDEEEAIERAIVELEIEDPQTRKRLVALRQG
jgi:hypothetical protein